MTDTTVTAHGAVTATGTHPERADDPPDPTRLAAATTTAVLADLDTGHHRGIVVDSPPGAGKSTLVLQAATCLADAREPVMIVAQTNEQVDDLTDRLATTRPDLAIGRLSADTYTTSTRVARHANVTVATRLDDMTDRLVVLATAAKWSTITADYRWPWAIIDEAYQMRSDLLLRVAGRFDRALFVGDPGQLDPFAAVQTDRWTGLPWDPMQSAVAVLLRHNPDLPIHRLPVSWRLPRPAATVVSDAFYPFSGFRAGSTPANRRLTLTTRAVGDDPIDETVETAITTGWALHELPPRHAPRVDAAAVTACVTLARRLLQRGTIAYSERSPTGSPLTRDRIAVGTAHRDQAKAVRAALAAADLTGVSADTANRLQGREFDVVIVLHPLSGRRDATAFHLEAGRLCVLTSRHRHACIVVARAGIPELLDAHPATEPVHLNVPAKFPDGWAANQTVMAHLEKWKVRAL